MKALAHHRFHFGRKQSAGPVVSPCNIFLIFSSLEANLQQRKKLKNTKLNVNLHRKQVAYQALYLLAHTWWELSASAHWGTLNGPLVWMHNAIETGLLLHFPPLLHVEGTAFQHSVTSHLCDFREVILTGWVLHNLSVNGKLKGL
uniref:Uncharacterized protein n=1 Tax=Pipistrellus kuhlii TaxID=59472 RepID=A0A7J7RMX3_PIPKU|nr:hypothetical protein mPipKuh1_010398 [Pipistrellus kuhlii]